MANGNEIARAYVTIVPSMQGSQSTITSELTGITTPASETAGEESGKHFGESLAKGLKATAGIVAGAMTAITAGAVATGKAFIDATKDVAEYGDTVDKESSARGNFSRRNENRNEDINRASRIGFRRV